MKRRGWLAAAVVTTACAAGAAPASGATSIGTLPEHLPSVAAGNYEWGASHALTGVTCDAACQRLVRSLNEEPGDPGRRSDLQKEAWKLGVATKTLPSWYALQATDVSFADRHELTWAVGSLARTKYVEEDFVGTPSSPDHLTYHTARARAVVPEHHITSSGEGEIYAPSDGHAVWISWSTSPDYRRLHAPPPSNTVCPKAGWVMPWGTIELTAPNVGQMYCGSGNLTSTTLHVPFRARTDYKPASVTARPVTNTTPSWNDEPASASILQERTKAELLTAKYPLYNQLASAAAKPDLYTDPRVIAKAGMHACDRGTPTYHNDGGNLNPHTLQQSTPFAVGHAPPTYPSTTSVPLKAGTAFWQPGRNHTSYDWGTPEGAGKPLPKIDQWGGWGHRLNAARNGWSAADASETQAALTNALPKDGAYETWIYDWTVARGAGDVACRRRVIIDVSGSPSQGITASYNMVVAG